MKVQVVTPDFINSCWDDIADYVEKVNVWTDDFNADHAKVYLVNGMWQLIAFVEGEYDIKGIAIVDYVNRPNDRVAFIVAIAGNALFDDENYKQFSAVVRANGATKMEGACRPSMVNLAKKQLRATEKCTVVEVKLWAV